MSNLTASTRSIQLSTALASRYSVFCLPFRSWLEHSPTVLTLSVVAWDARLLSKHLATTSMEICPVSNNWKSTISPRTHWRRLTLRWRATRILELILLCPSTSDRDSWWRSKWSSYTYLRRLSIKRQPHLSSKIPRSLAGIPRLSSSSCRALNWTRRMRDGDSRDCMVFTATTCLRILNISKPRWLRRRSTLTTWRNLTRKRRLNRGVCQELSSSRTVKANIVWSWLLKGCSLLEAPPTVLNPLERSTFHIHLEIFTSP